MVGVCKPVFEKGVDKLNHPVLNVNQILVDQYFLVFTKFGKYIFIKSVLYQFGE